MSKKSQKYTSKTDFNKQNQLKYLLPNFLSIILLSPPPSIYLERITILNSFNLPNIVGNFLTTSPMFESTQPIVLPFEFINPSKNAEAKPLVLSLQIIFKLGYSI